MKRPIFNRIGMKAIIVAFALMLFSNTGADAAYCSPTSGYFNTWGMFINLVQFDGKTIQKWDGVRDGNGNLQLPCQTFAASNYAPAWRQVDANNPVIKADKDKEYDMRCYGGSPQLNPGSLQPENVSPVNYYPQDFWVYVDCDQNGKFEETEKVGASNAGAYAFDCTFKVKIPKTAKAGNTTMRIICDYAYNNGQYLSACGTHYGEARDFAITIAGGVDIGISSITSPTAPLSPGVHPVKAILRNYSEAPITKCTIKWSVDAVDQALIDWTGYLPPLSQQEITLGDYDFSSKGVKSTFVILASTTKPNGEDDETPLNDFCPAYSVSLPLLPGIYYVGGTDYDFLSLKEVTDFLNLTDISTDGDFVFRVRPGSYTGPFSLDFDCGENSFIFESDPAFTGTVNLKAATNFFNYVWYINNIPNVTFRNMTITVTNPNSYGGRVFMIRGNADNFTFENNIINGVIDFTQLPNQYTLFDIQGSQMNNLRFYKNTFNDGYTSLVLINSSGGASSGLLIDKNKFNSFAGRAIHVEGIDNAVISNNTLKAGETPTTYGIYVLNGTDIVNNNISGIIGTAAIGSGIAVVHDAVITPATINSNVISGSGINGISTSGIAGGEINNNSINLVNSNLNVATNAISLTNTSLGTDKVMISANTVDIENGFGLQINNYNVDVLKNKIVVANSSSKLDLKGISATGSNGMILLNQFISFGKAMELNNSNFTVAYNSTLALGSSEALTVVNGYNQLYRNQFVNYGIGNAFFISSTNSVALDGNNYFSAKGVLGTISGVLYTTASQLLPIDQNARSTDPMYYATNSLKITELKEELIFDYPLSNVIWPEGYQAAYEETTFDGKDRNGLYYVGSYTIIPVVDISRYTKELIACAGSKDMFIICSGKANLGSQPRYQWYKDGVLLPGEISTKLSFPEFDYPVSGLYKCRVSTPGVVEPLWSGDIPVYALTTPDITEQPKEVINAQLGGTYNFNVKVHYRGLVPPYYEHFFQWYKYTAATNELKALSNDAKFQGTTAPEFAITGLSETDICERGDYYFVEIISQCGTIRSNPFIISQKPEVVFRDNPKDVEVCPNTNVVFEAFAIAPEGFNLRYYWQKDGVDLTDNAIYNGSNTNKLQIFNASNPEAGAYKCIAEIVSEGIIVSSTPGYLIFKEVPNAVAIGDTDYSIKRGNDVTFQVNLIAGVEPLTIKWTFKGEVIKEGIWNIYTGSELLTLLLEAINDNQSGEYICTIENECAKTEVKFNLAVKKWDEANSVEVVTENGYSLYTAVPNPATDAASVNYIMPKSGNVKFTLSDLSGRVLRSLYDGYAAEGMNTLQINVKTLDLPAGVYFYTMTSDKFSGVRSFVIVE